ncbi:hypothetical protein CK203_101579 [Vitis vinifera]|uniref:Retrovirus-related Pol polyprotein from transposon RE1 n=1 Tax=Vitis vinifera TaxID=29760 RepID=A0A438DMR9_VITVI|nr:hypothetical protein CK203_101579 [Vitis vinifera]
MPFFKATWRMMCIWHNSLGSSMMLIPFMSTNCAKPSMVFVKPHVLAKYCAITSTIVELNWIQHLLQELRIPSFTPSTIYYDNMGAIYLSANLVFHSHVKHILSIITLSAIKFTSTYSMFAMSPFPITCLFTH